MVALASKPTLGIRGFSRVLSHSSRHVQPEAEQTSGVAFERKCKTPKFAVFSEREKPLESRVVEAKLPNLQTQPFFSVKMEQVYCSV